MAKDRTTAMDTTASAFPADVGDSVIFTDHQGNARAALVTVIETKKVKTTKKKLVDDDVILEEVENEAIAASLTIFSPGRIHYAVDCVFSNTAKKNCWSLRPTK